MISGDEHMAARARTNGPWPWASSEVKPSERVGVDMSNVRGVGCRGEDEKEAKKG